MVVRLKLWTQPDKKKKTFSKKMSSDCPFITYQSVPASHEQYEMWLKVCSVYMPLNSNIVHKLLFINQIVAVDRISSNMKRRNNSTFSFLQTKDIFNMCKFIQICRKTQQLKFEERESRMETHLKRLSI